MSGIRDMRRLVRVMPADPEAAAELRSWSQQQDTTLDLSGLDASGADLAGARLAFGVFSGTGMQDTILIDDIRSIIEKNGWKDDVIWHP